MAVPVIMPRQGQSVESCIITEWTRNKGEKVEKGETICVYETDKASFELESPESGTLLEIFFAADDDVPVLTNIAVIGSEGESIDEFRPEAATTFDEDKTGSERHPEPKEKEPADSEAQQPQQPVLEKEETGISPRAKKLAEKSGINVKNMNVKGSGPSGRIIEQDIKNYLEKHGKPTPLAGEVAKKEQLAMPDHGTGLGGRIKKEDLYAKEKAEEPVLDSGDDYEVKKLSNIRKIIAENMYKSLQNSAQLTHHTSADARKILQLRKDVKAALEEGKVGNITLNDMVCFAVIKALKNHPEANSHFLGDQIRIFKKVHLGFAVDTERGLMVPALKNADDFSLAGLSNQLKTLANNSKKGHVDPELLASTAASFTISNLGAYDVEMFTPVINLPQSAILGVNTITHRPADLGDGVIGFVPHIGLSLTYDHRALDGAPASRFLQSIKKEIENFEYKID